MYIFYLFRNSNPLFVFYYYLLSVITIIVIIIAAAILVVASLQWLIFKWKADFDFEQTLARCCLSTFASHFPLAQVVTVFQVDLCLSSRQVLIHNQSISPQMVD